MFSCLVIRLCRNINEAGQTNTNSDVEIAEYSGQQVYKCIFS